jgi:DNA polymerase-3 subunit delta
MILKSYIVEQNIDVLKTYQSVLMYGKNDGIKDDIKEKLKYTSTDTETIIFFEEELLKDKNILYQNINNESLFSKKKIIFIHSVSDKIFDQVSECLEGKKKDIKIYLFSEVLEKRSKLRSLFEKSKDVGILPCYEDNERTLIAYVNKELKEFNGLTGEIVNLIISNSRLDRKLIKNELIKIKDFFLEKKINKKETLELLNIKTNITFDEIRDNALNGNKKTINKLLSQIDILNEETFFYLNNLSYRIIRLQEIIRISESDTNKYEQSLEKVKPPIFWKDKPIYIQQLRKWSLKGLTELITKIGETELLVKRNSYLRNDIIVKELIIGLTNKACASTSSSS